MARSVRFILLLCFLFNLPLAHAVTSSDANRHFLDDLFEDLQTCLKARALKKELKHEPLYRLHGGQCSAVNPDSYAPARLYAKADCSGETLLFKKTDFTGFCAEMLAPNDDYMGNAARLAGKEQWWTLNPSLELALSTLSIEDNYQPYMTRERYSSPEVRDQLFLMDYEGRDSEDEEWYADRNNPDRDSPSVITLRGTGRCDLTMRIYKKSPAETGLKPVLALHGGGWQLRGTPFVGFESEMSHLTERGFVVFVPFYRLVRPKSTVHECRKADWTELVADVSNALDWVKENGARYGAQADKVAVLGGSAGAHLGAWLTVNRKEDISKSVLFYPPTDFRAFIEKARNTEDELIGERIMAHYLGILDLETIPLDHPSVVANSFPHVIEQNPSDYPPVTLIHGNADTLVPSNQSVRLCNAYNGDVENGPAKDDGGTPSEGTFSKSYRCGESSHLHLVAEGGHSLDACTPLSCAAGGEESQAAVRQIMTESLDWLAE